MKLFCPPKGTQFSSIDSLARRLGVPEGKLLHISENVDKYWLPGKTIEKSDGSKRYTHNAKPQLKGIHGSIKRNILKPTQYPHFLHGSLPKRSIYTNARNHTRKSVLINEDIANFYPSTRGNVVLDIWKRFYKCSPEVASVLTRLTTHENMLPQGWICSSYIANLVFWDSELELYNRLKKRGFEYTRLADDVSVSTARYYDKHELTWVISKINAIFASRGYRIKRRKHTIKTRSSRQLVNNQLVNNIDVGLPIEQRKIIRSAIQRLEAEYYTGAAGNKIYFSKWQQIAGKVGRLKSGHSKQYRMLRQRLLKIKP